MDNPCDNCPDRQLYARMFDMHFGGADCPYECEEYERYLKDQAKEDVYAASAGCTDGGADGELRSDAWVGQSPVYCGKEGWEDGDDRQRLQG